MIEKVMDELSKKLDQPRFCKDCKWAKDDLILRILSFGINRWEFPICHRPGIIENLKIDPVKGKKSKNDNYCSVERKNFGPLDTCGPEGKYWEKKS